MIRPDRAAKQGPAGVEGADRTGPVDRLLACMDLAQCDGCDNCGLRCAGPVPMTSAEFEAIVGYLMMASDAERLGGIPAELPGAVECGETTAKARSSAGRRVSPFTQTTGGASWVVRMMLDASAEEWNTPCRFRDERAGRCRVYPVRPFVCRIMGHVPWLPCPTERVRHLPPEPLIRPALDAYCREPRMPFHAWLAQRASEEAR